METSRRHYGDIMETSQGYHGDIIGISREYHWNIMGVPWGYHGDITGISLGYHWDIIEYHGDMYFIRISWILSSQMFYLSILSFNWGTGLVHKSLLYLV